MTAVLDKTWRCRYSLFHVRDRAYPHIDIIQVFDKLNRFSFNLGPKAESGTPSGRGAIECLRHLKQVYFCNSYCVMTAFTSGSSACWSSSGDAPFHWIY